MKLQLKKSNNQIYIVDAELGSLQAPIAEHYQINIDNLWDKYLEALAEKESLQYKDTTYISISSFELGYLQDKKETYWSNDDLIASIAFGANWANDNQHSDIPKYKKDVLAYYQQLKLSKIPECVVEIEMESVLERSEYGMPNSNLLYCYPQGTFVSKPKLTANKVTITKIIL